MSGRASILLACAITLAACRRSGASRPDAPPARGQDAISLEDVRSWAYQIQGLDEPGAVETLERSRYDMLVVEPTSTDWSEDATRRFDTRAMVMRLRASAASQPGKKKLVLAYVDVGEAETWRWYWTWPRNGSHLPGFVVGADPDGWEGNHVVAYWSDEWRAILLGAALHGDAPWRSVLDEVVSDGFDGVYMDWVEAFDDERVVRRARAERKDPEKEMIALIGDIRRRARARNPSFLVVQQNASSLIDGHPELLDVIDAVAHEDTWFRGEADEPWDSPRGHDRPQRTEVTEEILGYLDRFRAAGKPVFTVDYTVEHAGETYTRARARGFIPYCSRAALSRLTTTPP